MRARVATVVTLVLMPLLSACGHGQSYCDAVRDHQSDLGSIASGGDRSALLQALPIFEDLQGKAPDDVADDWDLLVTRIRALDDALTHAHVDPTTYDAKHPPSDLDPADRAAIR